MRGSTTTPATGLYPADLGRVHVKAVDGTVAL